MEQSETEKSVDIEEVMTATFRGITEELKKLARKYSDAESNLIIIFDKDGVTCEREYL